MDGVSGFHQFEAGNLQTSAPSEHKVNTKWPFLGEATTSLVAKELAGIVTKEGFLHSNNSHLQSPWFEKPYLACW